jgi:hypothetical protein
MAMKLVSMCGASRLLVLPRQSAASTSMQGITMINPTFEKAVPENFLYIVSKLSHNYTKVATTGEGITLLSFLVSS